MADRGCKRRKQSNPRRKNVDLEHLPEDADPDNPIGMRPSLSPLPLTSKGSLLLSSEEGPLTNGAPEDRPRRMNGALPGPKKTPEEEKIQEYLQRSDTAVIYPEPVGGTGPARKKRKGSPDPVGGTGPACKKHRGSPDPVIEEPKVPNEYLLKCPHCEQVFSGPQAIHELKEHLAHSHKETGAPDSNFTCQKCNASFATKENLAKHKQFHNTNGQGSVVSGGVDDDTALRKFKCPECGKAFKFKHHLKEHLRIHSGEKPFVCTNCGNRFSHSGSFSSHKTGKKCLIVNLKVRKVGSRSPRGRGITQNNSFRPIIPNYRSSNPAGTSPAEMPPPLLPAGYKPSSEQFPGSLSNRQQPFLPLTFHPLLASQPHYPHLPIGHFPEVTHLLQQRRYDSDTDHHVHSQLSSHMVPCSSNPTDRADSPDGSPKPQGELNAVKKILEIVDATVTKQQKSPTTRPRNGLLSELLSAHPKSPQPHFTGDARCRFCSRLFDSRVDLHQHETYLCPEFQKSPRNHDNGNTDVESCENRTSPSALSVDCVLTLNAHYRMNPRPKKSEMIRLSRDLKCSARTVQEWFQMQARDFSSNGNHSPEPHQQRFSNGHRPFQQSVPHFNGAIPNCGNSNNNQIVPFHPIADLSPRLDATSSSSSEDQPLDLTVSKMKPDHHHRQEPNNNEPMSDCDSKVLNLSQRSSRTPPKVSSPYQVVHRSNQDDHQPNMHSSLLYKYMQMGNSNHQQQSPNREKSPNVEMPSSPGRSPSRTERPQSMSSPGGTIYADNSSNPSGTTGSYCHTDEPGDGNLYSPSGAKKSRLWNQGECDENTLEDILEAEEYSSRGSGKMRKSWKLHKVESDEGMYACDLCHKMFSKQSSLARHKYEHTNQRPFICDECSKAFKHKHHLTEHKRIHNGEKPFQCRKCHKRFSHSGSYSQHMNQRFNYCKPYHE